MRLTNLLNNHPKHHIYLSFLGITTEKLVYRKLTHRLMVAIILGSMGIQAQAETHELTNAMLDSVSQTDSVNTNSMSETSINTTSTNTRYVNTASINTKVNTNQASGHTQTQSKTYENADKKTTNNEVNIAHSVIASVLPLDGTGQPQAQNQPASQSQKQPIPLTATTPVKSGDIIEYQGNFTNTTQTVVSSMFVTLSIPAEVELLDAKATQAMLASIDGKTFYPIPLQRRVDGQLKDLELKHYRALRWTVQDLSQNQTANVKYRAKLK